MFCCCVWEASTPHALPILPVPELSFTVLMYIVSYLNLALDLPFGNHGLPMVGALLPGGCCEAWEASTKIPLRNFEIAKNSYLKPNSIIQIVCRYYGVNDFDITKSTRKREVVTIRKYCCYLITKHCKRVTLLQTSKLLQRNT